MMTQTTMTKAKPSSVRQRTLWQRLEKEGLRLDWYAKSGNFKVIRTSDGKMIKDGNRRIARFVDHGDGTADELVNNIRERFAKIDGRSPAMKSKRKKAKVPAALLRNRIFGLRAAGLLDLDGPTQLTKPKRTKRKSNSR
jgi:uncharacterized protein YtpQ (UPF0354 family)